MGRPELGTKCTCAGCAERFYDLNRLPPTCPKCKMQQALAKPGALRRPKPPSEPFRFRRVPEPAIGEANSDADEPDTAEGLDDAGEEDSIPEAEDDLHGSLELDPLTDNTSL